jgi:hypothetical protein
LWFTDRKRTLAIFACGRNTAQREQNSLILAKTVKPRQIGVVPALLLRTSIDSNLVE